MGSGNRHVPSGTSVAALRSLAVPHGTRRETGLGQFAGSAVVRMWVGACAHGAQSTQFRSPSGRAAPALALAIRYIPLDCLLCPKLRLNNGTSFDLVDLLPQSCR